MNSFGERFKDKISTVSKNGLLSLNPNRVVSKTPYQKSSLKSSAAKILGSSKKRSESLLKSSVKNPFRGDKGTRKHMEATAKVAFTEQGDTHHYYTRYKTQVFKPYTLKDYQNTQANYYYQLGGLGRSNIGTQEWNAKNQAMIRKNKYSEQLRRINYNCRKQSIE